MGCSARVCVALDGYANTLFFLLFPNVFNFVNMGWTSISVNVRVHFKSNHVQFFIPASVDLWQIVKPRGAYFTLRLERIKRKKLCI